MAYAAPPSVKSGKLKIIYNNAGLPLNKNGEAVFIILDMDSVIKYAHSGITHGIVEKAFLYKYYCKIGDTLVLK